METDKKKPMGLKQIKLEVSEKLERGKYANLCLVNNSDSEFIFDGFFTQPQKPAAKHVSRIIMAPRAAKRLYLMLGERLAKYEKMFGKLEVQVGPPPSSNEFN